VGNNKQFTNQINFQRRNQTNTITETITQMKRSELKELIREEYNRKMLNEADIDVPVPPQITQYMGKLAQKINSINLNRQKKLSLLDQFIKMLQIDKNQMNQFSSKIKQNM
jgi:hypothetical protein